MIHKLKIDKIHLDDLLSGRKRAEIRLNDRDYKVGDFLEFRDLTNIPNPILRIFRVTHMHTGLGLKRNYAVLSVTLEFSGVNNEY